MLVGYMRVSTSEQNLALQRDALEAAGCERLYEDTCSGFVTDRPGLARALDNLRRGDALVVWKLDRIGRSLGHVVELVAGLRTKGIGLKVLTGGIDTASSTGRLVFGIFATLAEFERDLIKERTMVGLAAARARGRTGGRPRVMTRAKLRTAMTMMADQGNAATLIIDRWEDLLRLAGSLKLGTVQASGLIRTLQTKDRPAGAAACDRGIDQLAHHRTAALAGTAAARRGAPQGWPVMKAGDEGR